MSGHGKTAKVKLCVPSAAAGFVCNLYKKCRQRIQFSIFVLDGSQTGVSQRNSVVVLSIDRGKLPQPLRAKGEYILVTLILMLLLGVNAASLLKQFRQRLDMNWEPYIHQRLQLGQDSSKFRSRRRQAPCRIWLADS